MSTDHEHDVEPPPDFEVPSGVYAAGLGLTAVGVVAFLVGLFVLQNPGRTWNAYLMGWWLTLCFGLAGPFIIATQYVSKGGWGTSIRRVPEAFGLFLAPATLLGVGALFGAEHILPWIDLEGIDVPHHAMHIIDLKRGFLNTTGLAWATVVSPLVLLGLAYWMRHNSVKQDETADPGLTDTNTVLSAIFLIAFGVGFSLLAWYWTLSLEPLWYATMWQVYNFAALFQSGLALTTIVVIVLNRRGAFGDFVGEHQIHSLGQLVFSFTVFYAYIAFCQFMLCWYANIPEESLFYVRRLGGLVPAEDPGGYGWFAVLWGLKFIAPFFILLPQRIKKNAGNILYYVCWVLVAVQVYEIWFWVAFTPDNPIAKADPTLYLPWLELAVIAGFVGLFVLVVARGLSSANILPVNDPYLHESLAGGHHGEDD